MYQQLGNALLGNMMGRQTQQTSPLGAIGNLAQNLGGMGGMGNPASNLGGLGSLLSGGLRCTQNEQRLMQEKEQRNLLKRYLIQQTGDPIQSALISSTIPGRGAGDTFDIGLGTRADIMKSLGITPPQTQNTGLLGNLNNLASMANTANQGMSLMNSLSGNRSSLSSLATLGNLANLGKSQTANAGLLSSLVNLASTPNNNGSILSNLGGLGTGFIGGRNSGGLLGNIQSGINTLNTINKVNNAVSGVKSLLG